MSDLARAMQALLPDSVAVAWADPRLDHPLLPGEGLTRAVASRQREYAAGRAAARGAMLLLGLPPAPVLRGDDRAPIWPDGMTGSITHTDTDCLAAVSRGPCVLGIDMERAGRVTPDLWPAILREDEQASDATLIFAAKEAVYKAQYPLTRQIFGFHRLHIACGNAVFEARFCADTGPIANGSLWQGRFARHAGLILTAVHAPT